MLAAPSNGSVDYLVGHSGQGAQTRYPTVVRLGHVHGLMVLNTTLLDCKH